jgi:MraZ protein
VFLGQYERTVDGKGRLTIPAKYRPELGDGIVITRGLDRCLAIYPMPKWRELSARVEALPITNRRARNFRRLVFSGAHNDAPDDQGRVLIPPHLRDYASLDGTVIVSGLSDYIEVWDPGRWEVERSQLEGEGPTAEDWASLEI